MNERNITTMKREIKFRGKPFEKGMGWQYGHLIKQMYYGKEKLCIGYVQNGAINGLEVNPDSVGQYTGLKDCNGKEIYEGDILRLTIPDGSTRHFVVEWAEEDRKLMPLNGFEHDGNDVRISGWCFNWNGYRLYPTVIDGIPDNEVMTIIGNVYDNLEILKGSKQ